MQKRHKILLQSISSSYSHKLKASIKNLTNRISKLENSPNPNSLLISHLKNILSNLEHKSFVSLTIRSRTSWYEKGERPSSYFFNCYKIHQSNMNIEQLYVPSSQDSSSLSLSNNNHQILSHAHSHFSTLWSNPPPLLLLLLYFNILLSFFLILFLNLTLQYHHLNSMMPSNLKKITLPQGQMVFLISFTNSSLLRFLRF